MEVHVATLFFVQLLLIVFYLFIIFLQQYPLFEIYRK